MSSVLVAHALGTRSRVDAALSHVFADIGVRAFFVLSGFLITSLLLKERRDNQTISLKRFYLRRFFRIFPAFYAYVIAIAVLAGIGLVITSSRDIVFALAYVMNFHADRAWVVGHLWSLAVEEQFYLLWPLLLVVCGARRASRLAIGSLVLAPVLRLAAWYLLPDTRPLTDQAFPCIFDSLATGCCLAIAQEWLASQPRYRRFVCGSGPWWLLLAALMLLAVSRPWVQLGVSMTVANVAIAIVIHRSILLSGSGVARVVLSHPVAVRLGVLSYSLYLWQQIFINRHGSAWFNAFPVNILLALATAALSYEIIEKPFMRLAARHRRSQLVVEPAQLRSPYAEARAGLPLVASSPAEGPVAEVATVARRHVLTGS